MGISLFLAVIGALLVIIGVALLILRVRRRIALACLILGIEIIVVPSIIIIFKTM